MLRSADFERVLAQAPRSRSAHFAVHHVAARPSLPKKPVRRVDLQELSTAGAPTCPLPVDELPADAPMAGWWMGTVVPKRHARRAVTRNLLKRQMREAMSAHAGALPAGLWVLRLKAPFDVRQFTSPASAPLRSCARAELSVLLQRAAQAR
ncbi:ribonuclease P protein component [Aquabacterium sp.]|uniref:ribonuclease P protein component n=1 Tax=Aquabacterium sp. TaxID=1872578 RepID=UPI002BB48CC7|nr:ribonuclease P protein component [Aquabacterium sp.]HSW04711.1 ribonuclease P protein component [Aquabacterium sp.]